MSDAIFKSKYTPTKTQLSHLQGMAGPNEDVTKSFETGTEINPANMTQAAALRTEFLAPRLSQLSFGSEQMVFFNMIPKMPASSTVAQYITFDQHGETGHTAWDTEAGISDVRDPEISRKSVIMKFASHTRQVSLVAEEVNNVESPIDVLTDDAIVSMARTIEQGSLYGDSSLSAVGEKDGLEPDGLIKWIPDENVIDLKGATIDIDSFNDAAIHILKSYGNPTAAFMPNGVLAYFNNNNKNIQRQFVNTVTGENQVSLGVNIKSVTTVGGDIRLVGSNVMENDNFLNTRNLGKGGAPMAPTVTAKKADGDAKVFGQFTDGDVSTGATYKVVTYADKSGSRPSAPAVVPLAKNTDTVKLTINVPNTYNDKPQYVAIYRTDVKTGQDYLIKKIGLYQAVDAEDGQSQVITFTDTNAVMPGTTDVFVGDMSPQVIRLYEFLPMFRLPLPSMNKLIQWSVVWSGGLAVLAPNRWVRITNVGYNAVTPVHM